MAADKPYPKKEKPDLTLGRGDVPPKCGTFTPSANYRVPTQDAGIEQILQDEQGVVARLIDDAVAALGNASKQTKDSDLADGTLRQRAQKLSLGARITARLLTKLRLDSKYPPRKQPSR